MRIGFFTECYRPIVNGVVASVEASREGLRRARHDVICITPSVPGYEDAENDVIRIPSLPLPTMTGYRLTVPVALDRRIGALDIVHAHSLFITGHLAARCARVQGVPLVFTYHTRLDQYAHYAPFGRELTRRGLAARTRSFANAAAAVVTPSADAARYLVSIGVGTRIEVVPSPVDLAALAAGRRREDVRARLGAERGDLLVLVAGRVAWEKNPRLALAAAAAAPRVRLAFAGEGPARAALEDEAARLGIAARVRFAGLVAPAEMPDLYASVDALLFPSTSETQGLVLAEAMAAGLPIVAVQSAATREIAGGAAAIVAPDAGAIAQALESIGPGRRQSAIQLASRRFSIEEQAGRLTALYESLRSAPT